jgi:peptidoglycan/LPS O-acetylase OafA/YrhL
MSTQSNTDSTDKTDSRIPESAESVQSVQSVLSKDRLPWVDVCRGLAILAVVLIHVFGRLQTQLTPGAKTWYAVAVLHHVMHFAVPAFLLISVFVNAGSLLRRWSPGRFLLSRIKTVVWPYLVWCAVYIFYQHQGGFAGFGWRDALYQVAYGKAYPHLYFMVVLIQILIVLPPLVLLFRRKPPFLAAAVGGIALTLAVYAANRFYLRMPYPGSFFMWYTPVIALGLWLASQVDRLPDILRCSLPAASLLTAVFALLYFWLGTELLLHRPVNSFAYQLIEWGYMTAASFLLVYIAYRWKSGWSASALRYLGRYSLQVYLVHPLILLQLDRVLQFHSIPEMAFVFVVYLAAAVAVPLAFAKLVEFARVSVLLFGR